ncbi:MAG: hypothetical protein WCH84_11840 [Verrucomicrobiota bacterium]
MANVLTVPVGVACFSWGHNAASLSDVLQLFAHWGYWLWIGVSVASQILLLAVPVAAAENRPKPKRPLLVPVLVASFLFSFLVVSIVGCVAVAIWKEEGLNILGLFAHVAQMGDVAKAICAFFVYVVVVWVVWAAVFYRFQKTSDPELVNHRLVRWLLKGSILELLIVVPSHVIVRRRDDCCAPAMTAWGIAAGLTVMLLSFGPGVFYLFVARLRRLQPNQNKTNL